jgi:hypothetical protein
LQLEVDAMLLLALTAPVASSNNCFKKPVGMLAGLLITFKKVAPGLPPLLGIFSVN